MTQIENIILDQKQIDHKIRRIAYQIFENNVSEKKLLLLEFLKTDLFSQKK